MTVRRVLLVFLGGTVGTAGRLALGLWITDAGGFPLATFVVNVIGAFLIGLLAARMPQTADLRVLLGTGVLGGFTTYSAFMTGTVQLWSAAPVLAAVYAAGSLVLGLAAAGLGLRLGRPRNSAAGAGAAP